VVKFLDLAINLVFNVFRDNDISVPLWNYPAQQKIYQNIITILLYLFKRYSPRIWRQHQGCFSHSRGLDKFKPRRIWWF